MNINKDYEVFLDINHAEVTIPRAIVFKDCDKRTSNIYAHITNQEFIGNGYQLRFAIERPDDEIFTIIKDSISCGFGLRFKILLNWVLSATNSCNSP